MIGRLSICSWSLDRYRLREGKSVDDLISMTADLGVDGIDFMESDIGFAPRPSLHDLSVLRRKVEAKGLDIVSLWFHTDLIARSVLDSVDATVADIAEYLAVAQYVGASYVCIQTGTLMPGMTLEEGSEQCLQALRLLEPIAREHGVKLGMELSRPFSVAPLKSPEGARRLVEAIGSEYIILIPDFEAWRHPSSLVGGYLEIADANEVVPASLEEFAACLPYAPNVQAKLLDIGEGGMDPNYPEQELLQLLADSPDVHDITVEYEGWLPDLFPERDVLEMLRAALPNLRPAPSVTRG